MAESGNVVRLWDFDAIDAEAAAWVARLDAGALSAEDEAAFAAWTAQSQHHHEAVERLGGLWSELDVLAQLATPPGAPQARPTRGKRGVAGYRKRAPRLAIGAAAVAASAALAFGFAINGPSILPPTTEVYETGVGAQRTVNLPDGSSVQLNTASRLEVRYTPGTRDLRLVSGEAYFDVAPDKARPFSVYTSQGVVRAVGTDFVVRLHDRKVEVTVTEGVVELASFSQPAPALRLDHARGLDRRLVARVSAKPGVVERAVLTQQVVETVNVAAPEATRQMAWRQGMLVFSGEPLSEVVTDVSRYTDVRIEIADPSLRSLKVGGYFKVGEVDPMLEALSSSFGVRVERVDDKHIRLLAAS